MALSILDRIMAIMINVLASLVKNLQIFLKFLSW